MATKVLDTEGHPPIPLLANSYYLDELLAATNDAAKIKDPDERSEAMGKIALECADNQDLVEQMNAPSVPEGHELAEVETASGETVTAPVPILDLSDPAPATTGKASTPSKPVAPSDATKED